MAIKIYSNYEEFRCSEEEISEFFEDDNFRIAVSGISGTMVWSSKIDILDMKGYAY